MADDPLTIAWFPVEEIERAPYWCEAPRHGDDKPVAVWSVVIVTKAEEIEQQVSMCSECVGIMAHDLCITVEQATAHMPAGHPRIAT